MRKLFFLLLVVSVSVWVLPVKAVNNAGDLIAAINAANLSPGADVITLTSDISIPNIYQNNIFYGDIGLPLITSNITINGNGFAIERDTSSGNLFRIISINGGTLTINDATIAWGYPRDGLLVGGGNILVANNGTLNLNNSIVETGVTESDGAGILNFSGRININNSLIRVNATYTSNQDGGGIYNAGTATITNSLILANVVFSSDGAGIYNSGTMTITNSTLSDNLSTQDGGAIYNSGTLTLNNVTITENTAFNASSGIYNSGTATLNNSIISGNQLGDCVLASGTFTAPANNIFGVSGSTGGCTGGTALAGTIDTLLEPRADNGGPTETFALVNSLTNPAIDASVGGTSSDQRGAEAFGTRDIGAYELSGIIPTVTVGTVSATTVLEDGGVVTIPVTVANFAGNSLTIIANISGGTATNNTDYTITTSLTFNGNDSLNFQIIGIPDALIEGDETLTVSFSLVGAADITGNGNQTVTILDIVPPPFSKAFAASPIIVGDITSLTFTIDNSASSVDATGLAFTDNLPAGMVVAAPANQSTTCTGGTITAVSGTDIITYTGGMVSAGTSCTVQVDIEGVATGSHVNTTGDLTSLLGNSGTASDSLTVIDTLGIGKSFVNDPVLAGATVDLEFTVTNGDLINDATGISFTDDLDATLTGLLATGLPLTDICGIGSQISGTNVLSFTGGSLSAGTACSFTVTLQVPSGAAVGDYLNTTSSITGTILALPVVETPASDTLRIRTSAIPSSPSSSNNPLPSIAVFDPAISKLGLLVPGQLGVQGESLEWIVTVSNTGSVVGNNVIVTDTLNPALQIDSVNAPNATVNINGQTVTVTYATLQVGETQQFSIFTTVLNGATVDNTACVTAANQGAEECATALPISQLPSTGETPLWREGLLALLGFGMLALLALKRKVKRGN